MKKAEVNSRSREYHNISLELGVVGENEGVLSKPLDLNARLDLDFPCNNEIRDTYVNPCEDSVRSHACRTTSRIAHNTLDISEQRSARPKANYLTH